MLSEKQSEDQPPSQRALSPPANTCSHARVIGRFSEAAPRSRSPRLRRQKKRRTANGNATELLEIPRPKAPCPCGTRSMKQQKRDAVSRLAQLIANAVVHLRNIMNHPIKSPLTISAAAPLSISPIEYEPGGAYRGRPRDSTSSVDRRVPSDAPGANHGWSTKESRNLRLRLVKRSGSRK